MGSPAARLSPAPPSPSTTTLLKELFPCQPEPILSCSSCVSKNRDGECVNFPGFVLASSVLGNPTVMYICSQDPPRSPVCFAKGPHPFLSFWPSSLRLDLWHPALSLRAHHCPGQQCLWQDAGGELFWGREDLRRMLARSV